MNSELFSLEIELINILMVTIVTGGIIQCILYTYTYNCYCNKKVTVNTALH